MCGLILSVCSLFNGFVDLIHLFIAEFILAYDEDCKKKQHSRDYAYEPEYSLLRERSLLNTGCIVSYPGKHQTRNDTA